MPEIYSKFKPESGKIIHTMESDNPHKVVRIGIEIDPNGFDYTDPFYGKVTANNTLNEFVNIECNSINLELRSIFELQSRVVKPNPGQVTGWFSNSLQVVVKEIKFGLINPNNELNCSLKYFLTKSDSYPQLLGKIEDHMKLEHDLEVDLKINNLLFLDKRENKDESLGKYIDKSVYQLENVKKTNLWTQKDWYEYLEIGVKKIEKGTNWKGEIIKNA